MLGVWVAGFRTEEGDTKLQVSHTVTRLNFGRNQYGYVLQTHENINMPYSYSEQ